MLFVLVAGGAGTTACSSLPDAAVRRIETAQNHYHRGRYADAKRLLNVVISDHPETNGVGQAYYVRGLCYYRDRQDDEALGDFEMALRTSSDVDLLARVQTQLGHLWYQRGSFGKAAAQYAQAVKQYPDDPSADETYYRYGDSLQKIGRWQESREVLPKVWHLFPNSALVRYARLKFSWPHDYFVIQCGSFDRSDLARELAQTLRRAGFEASVDVDIRQGHMKHVVYVGRHHAIDSAESQCGEVQAVVADAYVVP